MPVVSNSSPIIAFERIGRLDLLEAIFPGLVIPAAVAAEVAGGITLPSWIVVRQLRRELQPKVALPTLGTGEREAISLALELGARWVVLDDQAARRVAQTLGLPVIGTLGILLAAERRGLVPAIRPYLDQLRRKGFFMSPELTERVQRLAGE